MPISSPLDIAGCVLWLAADSIVGLSDGDPITTWDDGSSAANDATAAGSERPTYKTSIINGKPVARFDGTDDKMVCGASGTYKHWFVVTEYDLATFSGYDGLVTGTGAPETEIVFIANDGSAVFYNTGTLTTTYRKNGVDFVESDMQAPMSGVFAYLSISCAAGWAITPQLGLDRNNGSRNWDGDVAEVIAYDSVLSSTDRDSVEAYLNNKYFVAPSAGGNAQLITAMALGKGNVMLGGGLLSC